MIGFSRNHFYSYLETVCVPSSSVILRTSNQPPAGTALGSTSFNQLEIIEHCDPIGDSYRLQEINFAGRTS